MDVLLKAPHNVLLKALDFHLLNKPKRYLLMKKENKDILWTKNLVFYSLKLCL